MAARELVPKTAGQTGPMFPKLNGGQIAQLAAIGYQQDAQTHEVVLQQGGLHHEDERVYLRTCRKIAAEEIARSGFTEAAKQAAVERINARFPYINPTGINDIVRSSVDGLFQELSMPNEAPVRASQ